MNILRNQWSVSGQTVAVMQLIGSDEMGCVERGVPSSRPGHQSCSLYARTLLSCRRCIGVLEASEVVEVVVWCRLRIARAALFSALCNLSTVVSGASYNKELQ